MSELVYGEKFVIPSTTNPLLRPYVGVCCQVVSCHDGAIVANPQTVANLSVFYVEFDGVTAFTIDNAFPASFNELNSETPVLDLELNQTSPLADFAPELFPEPEVEPEPDWGVRFAPETMFRVLQSDNPNLQPYVGYVFKSLSASQDGVLGLPALYQGINDSAVYLAFDGQTSFEINPEGTWSFYSGINAGGSVYNSTIGSYEVVEEFYPAFGFGLFLPPLYPIVVLDPFYISPGLSIYW